MKPLKKLYKDFFGLKEQTAPTNKFNPDPQKLATYNKELEKTAELMKGMSEGDLDEAQLINNITDYRGGVEFVLRDPSTAQAVVDDIQQWTAKKGITLVTKKISKSGNVVYMYFRLGQDPSSEAQKVQGYLAQMPELKHFRFNVRQPKKKIQPQI
jgi:hypothetical protein